jgi:DNA-binding transcriptional regulator YiaG
MDYRRQSRLTQEAFAKQIGASIESIKNWESGRTLPVKQFWSAIRSILATV